MNIIDALPFTLIKDVLEFDASPSLHKDYIDFNTKAKSDLFLFYENGEYIAKMRYGQVVIETMYDFYNALSSCLNNDGYASQWVHDYLRANEIVYDDRSIV